MIARPWYAAWLALVWIVLWRGFTIGNVAAGVVLSAVLLLVFPPERRPRRFVIHPLRLAHFAGYFLWKLIEASGVVAWEIVTPQNKINEGIVAVPLSTGSEALVTMVANSISLTPGTLTVEIQHAPTVLYVHVLHLRSVEEVRRDVEQLERLLSRAIEILPERTADEPGTEGVHP